MRNASFWFRGTENSEDGEERDGSETTAREEEEASTLVNTAKGKATTNAPIVEEVDPVKVRFDQQIKVREGEE